MTNNPPGGGPPAFPSFGGHAAGDSFEKPLAGRVALVTGAAGDIGRAVCVRLAQLGVVVVAADLDVASEGMAATAAACHDAGAADHAFHAVAFDVTDHDAVGAAVADICGSMGVPTVVCNIAGYQGNFANIVDADIQDFETVLRINVTGVFSVLQHTAGAMKADGQAGSIVNMASMAGVGAPPNMGAYAASKSAVLGLTRSAAKDLAPVGIRVNAVSPAFIGPGVMWDRQVELQAATPSPYFGDTREVVARQMIGQVPLGRYGDLDEVAAGVQFLASPESSYITGFNLEVSGGAA